MFLAFPGCSQVLLADVPAGTGTLGAMDNLTSSARLKAGDSSRSPGGLRCRFAVHRRASLRKKAPRAATACPAAVLRADGLALAADSLTVPQGTDKTEGGKRRCLSGLNARVSAPRL